MVDTERRHIRDATALDIPRVLELTEAFYLASPYFGKVPFDPEKVTQVLKLLVACDDNTGKIILALDLDGVPQGCLLCMSVEPIFSTTRVASELMWWVEPDYRGSRMALELLRAYEDWCRLHEYPFAQMALLDALNGPAVERFYLKNNYELVEKAFMKRF